MGARPTIRGKDVVTINWASDKLVVARDYPYSYGQTFFYYDQKNKYHEKSVHELDSSDIGGIGFFTSLDHDIPPAAVKQQGQWTWVRLAPAQKTNRTNYEKAFPISVNYGHNKNPLKIDITLSIPGAGLGVSFGSSPCIDAVGILDKIVYVKLPQVGKVSCIKKTNTSFQLSWPAVDGADRYIVQAFDSKGRPAGESWSRTGLLYSGKSKPATKYTFEIRAYNRGNVSDVPRRISVTTYSNPPKITSISALSKSRLNVKLKHDPKLKIEIYRSTSKKSGFKKRFTLPKGKGSTFFQDGGLKANKTYYYKVRKIEANGTKGLFSAITSGKTKKK